MPFVSSSCPARLHLRANRHKKYRRTPPKRAWTVTHRQRRPITANLPLPRVEHSHQHLSSSSTLTDQRANLGAPRARSTPAGPPRRGHRWEPRPAASPRFSLWEKWVLGKLPGSGGPHRAPGHRHRPKRGATYQPKRRTGRLSGPGRPLTDWEGQRRAEHSHQRLSSSRALPGRRATLAARLDLTRQNDPPSFLCGGGNGFRGRVPALLETPARVAPPCRVEHSSSVGPPFSPRRSVWVSVFGYSACPCVCVAFVATADGSRRWGPRRSRRRIVTGGDCSRGVVRFGAAGVAAAASVLASSGLAGLAAALRCAWRCLPRGWLCGLAVWLLTARESPPCVHTGGPGVRALVRRGRSARRWRCAGGPCQARPAWRLSHPSPLLASQRSRASRPQASQPSGS
jgi:hypothetical protein